MWKDTCPVLHCTENVSLAVLFQLYIYEWVSGPVSENHTTGEPFCVRAPVRLTIARSPAFELGQYGSTEYSTWTESRWKNIGTRIFLVASPQLQVTRWIQNAVDFVLIIQEYTSQMKYELLRRFIHHKRSLTGPFLSGSLKLVFPPPPPLSTSLVSQMLTLGVGIAVLLVSLVVTYFISSKADILFSSAHEASSTTYWTHSCSAHRSSRIRIHSHRLYYNSPVTGITTSCTDVYAAACLRAKNRVAGMFSHMQTCAPEITLFPAGKENAH